MAEGEKKPKELTGDVPARHVKVDNMKSAFKAFAKAIDEKRDRDTFSAIANIIKQYKDDYNAELSDRNKYLVRYIYQNEKKFLQDFIDDEQNFQGLKKKIESQIKKEIEKDGKKGITVEKAQVEIVDAVKKALVAAIRDTESKSAKTKGKTSSKTGIAKKQLAEFAKTAFRSTLVGKEYRAIVDDMKLSYIDKSRKIYTDKLQKFKDNIAKLQKDTSKLLPKTRKGGTGGRKGSASSGTAKGNSGSAKTAKKKTNLITKNLKSGQIELLPHERAMGRKLSNRILRRFTDIKSKLHRHSRLDGFLKVMLKVGKVVGVIGSAIGKALKASLKVVSKIVIGPLKASFKVIGWIKDSVVMKLFGHIGKLFGAVVLAPLSKNFFSALFTPAGMFALGYVTAWLWDKIKRIMPKIGDFFSNRKSDLMDTVEWIVGTISDITDTVKQFIGDIVVIAKKFTRGFWQCIKNVSDFVTPFFDFLSPGLCGFLFGSLVTTISKVKSNPLFRAIKGLKGQALLIGIGAILLINAISNVFSARDKYGVKYVKSGLKDYAGIKQSKTNELAVSSLTEADSQKFSSVMQGMDADVMQIKELTDDIEAISKIQVDGCPLSDNDSKFNLYGEFPGLFNAVFSSSVFGDEKYPATLQMDTSANQIKALTEHLSYRIDKLKILKTAMYSATNVKQIEGLLKNISFTESKNADGGTEYNLGGINEELNKTLLTSAKLMKTGRMVYVGGSAYHVDVSAKDEAKNLLGNKSESISHYGLSAQEQSERIERNQLKTWADDDNQKEIDRRFFKTDDKHISDKLKAVEGDASGRTNLEKIKVMMGHEDVIRFKHASNEDKNKMIDEFLAKYKEREMTRIKSDKNKLKAQIEELTRKILIKEHTNADLMDAIKKISPWVKDFKEGVKTGNKAVAWAL